MRRWVVSGALAAALLAWWACARMQRVAVATSLSCLESAASHAKQSRPVFVLFHAKWCPNCATAKKRYRAVAETEGTEDLARLWRGHRFYEVDIETVPSSVQEYGVDYVPLVIALSGRHADQVQRLGEGQKTFDDELREKL
jgi:thiol-disulfide isomerase/thioredoxin